MILGINIFAINAVIKNYKKIVKKKHDKTVFWGKDKLSTLELLISNSSIDSYISHEEYLSVNNVLREKKLRLKTK